MFLSIPAFLPIVADASGEGWLTGWDYRKELTVSGATGAGTDYQVDVNMIYDRLFELTIEDNWADHAHQGVTTDGDFIYSTSSSDLTKYYKDGTFEATRDTTNDGSYGDYIGDLTYYSEYLYVASHDAGFTTHKVMKYDPEDLSFIEEFDVIEPTVTNWDGGLGISYNNGYFWLISDSNTAGADFEIQQYSTNFTQLDSWEVDSFYISGSWHYQGLDWFENTYIFCPMHEGSDGFIDVYRWNGNGFDQYQRIVAPSWEGSGNTNTASQGIEIVEEGSNDYVWLASRNGVDDESEIGKFSLSGLTGYVSMDGNGQTDFDDVRFTDNDGETTLDHWREDVTDNFNATFWIEVSDSLETATTIFLYYGNSGASDSSDGTATFPLFEDWTSETIGAQWDIKATDGSVSWDDTDAEHGSVIKVQGNAGANRYYFISDDTFETGYSFRMRTLAERTAAANQITQIGFEAWGNEGKAQLKSMEGDQYFFSEDSGGAETSTVISNDYFNSYQYYDITLADTTSRLYSNGVLVSGAGDNDPNVDPCNIIVYCRDTEYDLYNDWLFVHKYFSGGPEVTTSGAESGPLGAGVYWGINTATVFLGLCMIPASVLLFVRGGKDDLDSDKFFYFLIMFVMGWALFVGGIMP